MRIDREEATRADFHSAEETDEKGASKKVTSCLRDVRDIGARELVDREAG
jgi:hypothetical protein